MPLVAVSVDATETGTYGGFDNKVQIIQKIPHEGEVNRYASGARPASPLSEHLD